MFLGEYEHSLDAKRRLAIPAVFRDAMNPEVHGDTFIAAPGANGSLWLWPERVFAEATAEFAKGDIAPDPRTGKFARFLFTKTAKVPFDSAGRVRIPDRLLDGYGLKTQVIVLGVGNHLELVEPEAWRALQDQEDSEADVFEALRMARLDR